MRRCWLAPGKNIPAFHYMVAVAGGSDIPLVPYATFGTPELAENVAAGLRARKACLMAHHGQVAMGTTLASALELAHEVEVLAEQYCKVLALGPCGCCLAKRWRPCWRNSKATAGRRGRNKPLTTLSRNGACCGHFLCEMACVA